MNSSLTKNVFDRKENRKRSLLTVHINQRGKTIFVIRRRFSAECHFTVCAEHANPWLQFSFSSFCSLWSWFFSFCFMAVLEPITSIWPECLVGDNHSLLLHRPLIIPHLLQQPLDSSTEMKPENSLLCLCLPTHYCLHLSHFNLTLHLTGVRRHSRWQKVTLIFQTGIYAPKCVFKQLLSPNVVNGAV